MFSINKKYWSLGARMILIVSLVILLPYLVYVTWLVGGNIFHQIKWRVHGSPNYEIKSELNDFSEIRGIYTIKVMDNKIDSVDIIESQYVTDVTDLNEFDKLTIHGMFQKVFSCLSEYPRLMCTFEYDPEYGYPSKINIDCPNPDTCYENYETINTIYVKTYEK